VLLVFKAVFGLVLLDGDQLAQLLDASAVGDHLFKGRFEIFHLCLQLKDALLVNPHSVEQVSETIKVALEMPLNQRRKRHERLLASVRDEDVVRWREDFVRALTGRERGVPTQEEAA
jgi:hypothetical protein